VHAKAIYLCLAYWQMDWDMLRSITMSFHEFLIEALTYEGFDPT
jgi:hypothetical protein